MKYVRILCLALCLVMVMGMLLSCNDGSDPAPPEQTPSSWDEVDFEGATLTVSVSKNQDDEVTFCPGDIYTKGPDNQATSDTIAKKVLARNKRTAEELGIKVVYETTNWRYNQIMDHLDMLVGGDAEDAPDVYHNDIYAMVQAMLAGYLWNVSNPGKDASGREVFSFFDFEKDCWYTDYMEGATFNKDKMYILAGDYNIDILRYAWVFFVNKNLWDATYANYDYGTYEEMCEYIVDTGDWYYDDIVVLSDLAHRDGTSGTQGVTDKTDAQIGCCINGNGPRVFVWGSGLSLYEWTKNGKQCAVGEGIPSFVGVDDIGDYVRLGEKFTTLYNAKGVLAKNMNKNESTVMFMDGKTVMAMVQLGEMESEQMRGTDFGRGILPFPRFDKSVKRFTTMVHDQAEVDTVLNNASSFEMASAFLQHINEGSKDILNMYYEEVLKFKYNDSPGARKMIDIVYQSSVPPLDSVLAARVFDRAGGGTAGSASYIFVYYEEDARLNRLCSFSGTYAGIRDALQSALEDILEDFDKLQ